MLHIGSCSLVVSHVAMNGLVQEVETMFVYTHFIDVFERLHLLQNYMLAQGIIKRKFNISQDKIRNIHTVYKN
jgi:hypothetical protein